MILIVLELIILYYNVIFHINCHEVRFIIGDLHSFYQTVFMFPVFFAGNYFSGFGQVSALAMKCFIRVQIISVFDE